MPWAGIARFPRPAATTRPEVDEMRRLETYGNPVAAPEVRNLEGLKHQ